MISKYRPEHWTRNCITMREDASLRKINHLPSPKSTLPGQAEERVAWRLTTKTSFTIKRSFFHRSIATQNPWIVGGIESAIEEEEQRGCSKHSNVTPSILALIRRNTRQLSPGAWAGWKVKVRPLRLTPVALRLPAFPAAHVHCAGAGQSDAPNRRSMKVPGTMGRTQK